MNIKILIIDDDPAILEAIKYILEDNGYEVAVCANGASTEDSIIKNKPALIIMDYWLSDIDGDVIIKKLKTDDKTKNIPIIFLSASNDAANIAKLAGADDFLAKPFEISDLLDKVRKYV